jgi:hypothetical protein
MPSTHKKVIVRKIDRDTVNGHVAPANFVRDGKLELLNTSGNVVAIDLGDIKCVFFVREFGDSDSLSRKTFTTRPRSEGLWVRIKFKDGEILEGLMPNDQPDDRRRIPDQPSRFAIERATALCASRGAGITYGFGSDWRNPTTAPGPRRPAPSADVRRIGLRSAAGASCVEPLGWASNMLGF